MKKGICTKCSGTNVYANSNLPARGDRAGLLGHDGWPSSTLWLHAYVCIDCGFFEEYLRIDVLSDVKRIDKIKDNWTKI